MENEIRKTYFPIIRKHYPNCAVDDVQIFDNGYDHFVLVVDTIHAFRFPRTKNNWKKDHIEIEFFKQFASTSPIRVQQISGHRDEVTKIKYQTYEFLQGIPFSKEMAAKLKEEELLGIAKDLGNFLSHVHTFPISEAKRLNMDSISSAQDYGQYFKDMLEPDKKLLYPLLTQKEWEWIEHRINIFFDMTQHHPFRLTVTHSDFVSDHILINEQTKKVSGIIDFSLRIADAANDFKMFDRYGEKFLKTVYGNYFPVDKHFDQRRKFYAGDFLVGKLYFLLKTNSSKAKQEYYLKELKEYIVRNPL